MREAFLDFLHILGRQLIVLQSHSSIDSPENSRSESVAGAPTATAAPTTVPDEPVAPKPAAQKTKKGLPE